MTEIMFAKDMMGEAAKDASLRPCEGSRKIDRHAREARDDGIKTELFSGIT